MGESRDEVHSREGAERGGQDKKKEEERVGVAGVHWFLGRQEPKDWSGDLRQQRKHGVGEFLCPQS